MAKRQGVVAWEQLDLHESDPSAVWVVVGDPDRLTQWADVDSVRWSGDLPQIGDRFSVSAGKREITGKVVDWEAGRRYRVDLEGIPNLTGASLECGVESVVEPGHPGASLKIQFGAVTSRWRVPIVRMTAGRHIRRALARVQSLVG